MTIKSLRKLKFIEREQKELVRLKKLYSFEDELRDEGYKLIAGVDEAGRGSLAGAMVIAAVILPPDLFIEHLNDSKKLTHTMREKLYSIIVEKAVSFASVMVDIEEIDKFNVYQATLKGMYRAVKLLPNQPDYVLTDAMKVRFDEPIKTKSIIHGDALSASIAAASIIAKVTRDRMTDYWHKIYPQYGFSHNRGYGTKSHIEAIYKYGSCPLHRRSFEPIKTILSNQVCLFKT